MSGCTHPRSQYLDVKGVLTCAACAAKWSDEKGYFVSSDVVTAQMLATALRDVTTEVILNTHGQNPEGVWNATAYIERLLEAFVEQEGDIRFEYLPEPS